MGLRNRVAINRAGGRTVLQILPRRVGGALQRTFFVENHVDGNLLQKIGHLFLVLEAQRRIFHPSASAVFSRRCRRPRKCRRAPRFAPPDFPPRCRRFPPTNRVSRCTPGHCPARASCVISRAGSAAGSSKLGCRSEGLRNSWMVRNPRPERTISALANSLWLLMNFQRSAC